MEIARSELDERLERADRARTKLRRASGELRQLGDEILATRNAPRGSERPHRRSPRRR